MINVKQLIKILLNNHLLYFERILIRYNINNYKFDKFF